MTSAATSWLIVFLSIALMFLKNNARFKLLLADKLQSSLAKLNKHIPLSTDFKLGQSAYFRKSEGLLDVFNALEQLQEYGARAQTQNAVVYHRSKALHQEQIEQLRLLNYYDKLERINEAIDGNQIITRAIVENALSKLVKNNRLESDQGKEVKTICNSLGYTCHSDRPLEKIPAHRMALNPVSNQARVNEAISHLCRDWHQDYALERKPLSEFAISRMRHQRFKGKTLVVVPGSGVGGLAYEVASAFPEFGVHSIELSTLMYLCNEFALNYDGEVPLRPFLQHFSGQLSVEQQTRSFQIDLSTLKKPPNLKVHLGNFCNFKVPTFYDQIVVLSAFFIDTAENLFDYFEATESLKASTSELHWINIGPLKYGTRPKIQLTDQELTKLREVRKWKDLYHSCDPKELSGYLTNEQSLYQGYYGLVKFHSVYTGE
ncbi:LADA_0C05842g1_1 [Lachancea dasiensis]|uniref:LADA_0C05842g1_1 n=1 Tax=Lachancea dasiensis TaxID=1072105 RepID=A0A1G4IZD4_9SACH|nr:LADA_0C05842g1_1 [Lachancea dasiensis]